MKIASISLKNRQRNVLLLCLGNVSKFRHHLYLLPPAKSGNVMAEILAQYSKTSRQIDLVHFLLLVSSMAKKKTKKNTTATFHKCSKRSCPSQRIECCFSNVPQPCVALVLFCPSVHPRVSVSECFVAPLVLCRSVWRFYLPACQRVWLLLPITFYSVLSENTLTMSGALVSLCRCT